MERKLKILNQSISDFAAVKSFVYDEEIDLNFNEFPWQFKNSYFKSIEVHHVMEIVDSPKSFMEELYRICELEATVKIHCRYYNSTKQHTILNQKRQISEYSFLPFNRNWRVENNIEEQVNCNFEFTYGYDVGKEWSLRSDEARNFAIKHYCNVVDELIVELIKKN